MLYSKAARTVGTMNALNSWHQSRINAEDFFLTSKPQAPQTTLDLNSCSPRGSLRMSVVSMGIVTITWCVLGFSWAFGNGGPIIGNFDPGLSQQKLRFKLCELWSILRKGSYMGDYIGDYCRGH